MVIYLIKEVLYIFIYINDVHIKGNIGGGVIKVGELCRSWEEEED